MTRTKVLETLELTGLELAPPQTSGGIRLVPLLRKHARDDLRLARRSYADDITVVSIDGELRAPGVKYVSYVPHGLVMSWSDDGSPVAAFGAELRASDGKPLDKRSSGVSLLHRMARREHENRLRFLPLHLAMEGFLALHFGGPEIAWSEYSRRALSNGLDPRWEDAVPGAAIFGLADALRVFEIHERQAGVLVFVADALASAFVVPHPGDYALLHRSLLEDFYGALILQYSVHATENVLEAGIDETRVASLSDLARELDVVRAGFRHFQLGMSEGLLGKRVRAEKIYRAGPFQLLRFSTELSPSEENHIGEAIVRENGDLEYLKTFRLSAAQTRRAFLLSELAAQNWNLEAAAEKLRQSKDDLIRRLEKAGFDYLLKEHVLAAARRRSR
jgi:hypothetical protein